MFFFVHNIFFFLHKNNFFHILPPILSDFMSHVPQKTKHIAGKKVGFLAIKYQIGWRCTLFLRGMRQEVCCSVIYGFFTINYKKAFYSLLISILHSNNMYHATKFRLRFLFQTLILSLEFFFSVFTTFFLLQFFSHIFFFYNFFFFFFFEIVIKID